MRGMQGAKRGDGEIFIIIGRNLASKSDGQISMGLFKLEATFRGNAFLAKQTSGAIGMPG
jgi:hypothetical protein